MKPINLLDFAHTVDGKPTAIEPNREATGFALDNREVKPGDLFLAIKGANVDGHDFAPAALKAGAVAALVERPIEGPHILVDNVVQALARYAAHIRQTFRGPVVAITGSAGKTTTKEMVAAALSPLGKVLKTTGNRNSEFTSPLIWAELEPDHRAVVVEMGMRGFGQVAHLASFTKPNIGIVTNIGVSHIELVGSREGIARAKAELLQALPTEGHAILWADDPFLDQLKASSNAQSLTFGFSQNADCRIVNYWADGWKHCSIEGKLHDHPFHASLPAAGRHIALNAAAAIAAAAVAGISPADAGEALKQTELPPMRMQIVEEEGVTFILDAYNASPPSVIAALETFADVAVPGRRMAVLGEMRELGSYEEQGHREVGAALARSGIGEAVLFGETTKWIAEEALNRGFPAGAVHYAPGIGEISSFLQSLRPGDAVLIKGSRALELERALHFLKEPVS